MFVMLPVMFLARKLDSEDPNIVFYLRVAYGCIQVVNVLIVLYTYLQAQKVKADRMIYVPPPPVVSLAARTGTREMQFILWQIHSQKRTD